VQLTKAQKKKLKEKKNKFIKQIKDKLDAGEVLSTDETTNLASKWMEFADVDNSGTIDATEFKDMVNKLDEKFDESKVSEIFAAQDADGNGELTVESFGKALYECLSQMKNDEGEAEENE
jgi:Ca2+-binding EF-hand superfamily protein